MSNDLFSIGSTALTAAYVALRTSGNNVANANTPGYSRQTATMSAATGTFLGGFYVGQGVQIDTIKREYNDFLTQSAHLAQAQSSQADTRLERLEQLSTLFSDTTNGIGNTVDDFFKSVQSLTQNPADGSARQSLLSSGQLLAQRFDDMGAQLQDMRNSTDAQLRQEIDGVNALSTQIADFNDKIALARGTGRTPNDLLDKRDAAIRQLNAAVRVTGVPQDDGAINLFLTNGQPLVVGNRAGKMDMQVSTLDPQEISVGVRDAAGNLMELASDKVGGGAVAGLLQFRAKDLPAVENKLGQMAVTLSDQFNAQHKLGNDANGVAGTDFFKPPVLKSFAAARNTGAGTVSASFVDTTQIQASDYALEFRGASGYMLTRASDGVQTSYATLPATVDGMTFNVSGTPAAGDVFMIQPTRNGARNMDVAIQLPAQIAAASPVSAAVTTSNKGSLKVSDLAVNGPTRNPALTTAATLNFTSATSFSINGGAAQTFAAGTPISFNGWSLTLAGTPAAGDTVTVGAASLAAGDNRNMLKLAQMPDQSLVSGGRVSGAYGALVSTVGGLASGARTTSAAQTTVLDDAINAESSVSGVNLDEEASRLMQFQQQYQAAAKVIQVGRTIFDEVLSLGR